MQDYHNILLATDLSPQSIAAMQRAGMLARRLDARLTLVYVVEGFPEDLPVRWIPPEDEDPKHFLEARATRELRTLAEQAGCADADLKVLFCDRGPCLSLTDYAAQQDVDLLVLASPAHQGIRKALGSTVASVMEHAPCDVLAVRMAG